MAAQVAHWMRHEFRQMRGVVETLRCLAAAIEFFGLAFLGLILAVSLWSVW
ncbi:hypothetical protein [Frigidibacter sp. MR17.24]|uniref:hypothetical protein n=1 Tax=Frigidibacter sp. MR17.24 TaxID=3127345 RepID=UPI00301318F1